MMDVLLLTETGMDTGSSLNAAGHGPDNKTGTAGGIAADEDVLGIRWKVRL